MFVKYSFSPAKIIFLNLILVNLTAAVLNIYLDSSEVLRLLGINAELYYVQEGVVKQNAVAFTVTVPFDIDEVHFTWQSLESNLIPYTINLGVSETNLLKNIMLNISDVGDIPNTKSAFSVTLPSCELTRTNYTVYIDIAVTLNKFQNNITQFSLKRKKICPLDLIKQNEKSSGEPTINDDIAMVRIQRYYIIVSICSSAVTIFIIFAFSYFFRKKDMTKHNILRGETGQRLNIIEPNDNESTPFVPVQNPPYANTGTSTSSSHSSVIRRRKNYTQLDNQSTDIRDRIAEITIQRNRIRLQRVELEGTFGKVFYGTYTKEDGCEEDVIVKTVMDFASSSQISLLLKEGLSMYGLRHKNIMTVLGVSIEDRAEPFVIYSRQNYTNLKKFLQKCKICPEGVAHTLTTQEVVMIALQIISGIMYMHKKKLLHKDLATRNCVIDNDLNIKITDNALSRDLFPNDYHCLGDNENRPIKWLAIESLTFRTFSTASDTWAFGVTLWELTTLAQQPYLEIDPFEIEHYLKDGYRLSQPINCPDQLFTVMAYCWAMSSDDRPTFAQLYTYLQDFHSQLNKYV